MVYSDIELAKPFVSENDFKAALVKANQAFLELKNKSGAGSEWLGWRDLLQNPDYSVLNRIKALSDEIKSKADIFIVCGIGGSYLGPKAIIGALTSHFNRNSPEIIYAGHHIGGKYLEELLGYIDTLNEDGSTKSVYVNVISKSGTTLETALAFRELRTWMESTYGEGAKNRIVCTTSEEGGVLNDLIDEKGYQKFVIPKNVGGRFSVLTPVGLLPIAIAGIDIDKIFEAAASAFNHYEQDSQNVIEYAALRYCLFLSGISTDVLASFEPELHEIGGWLQQLLGESEGKEGLGIFPSVASYSTDLHSIGQFVQEGKRNLMETFLIVEDTFSNQTVAVVENDIDGLGYLEGMSFHEINAKAREGTVEAHKNGGVPIIKIYLQSLDETTIGELIYFFELFTAVYVYTLEINPFDQPGVEGYKKAMYRLLGKS